MRHEAHPMIQPTDWSRTPDELRGAMPEERRKLYQIIWDCALACTLKPPVLVHERAVYTAQNGTAIAFATVAVGSRQGYWRFRQDEPRTPFTVGGSVPKAPTLHVTGAVVVPDGDGVPVSAVLGEMERNGLATPATAARNIKHLVDTKWLRLVPGEGALQVALATTAARWLPAIREAGLTGRAAANNAVIESVVDGQTSYRDALVGACGDAAEAERAAKQIDELCGRWKGLSRLAGIRAARREAVGVPHHPGLPAWLDPEVQLPADHRWRARREEMESALATERPEWLSMGDEARAKARLEWLREHAEDDAELLYHLDGNLSALDVLRYWMTGAK